MLESDWLPFVISATTILFLYLKRQHPFSPPVMTLFRGDNCYAHEIFLLPVFGFFVWLLMGAVVHLILKASGKNGGFFDALNIIGIGMLVPMPVVWVWDWTMLSIENYSLMPMAISHIVFQL